MGAQEKEEKKIHIYFNEQEVIAPKETWTGKELRDFLMAQTDWTFAWLYKELPGKIVDTLIRPDMTVTLKDGDRFYDLPPAIKGSKVFPDAKKRKCANR